MDEILWEWMNIISSIYANPLMDVTISLHILGMCEFYRLCYRYRMGPTFNNGSE